MTILSLLAALAVADLICRIHDRFNARWVASVGWEGDWYTHASKDEAEAREWLACYPGAAQAAILFVFHGRARVVAARWPS